MPHRVEPRKVVVGDHRKIEASRFGSLHVGHELLRTGLFAHHGVAELRQDLSPLQSPSIDAVPRATRLQTRPAVARPRRKVAAVLDGRGLGENDTTVTEEARRQLFASDAPLPFADAEQS